jgi:serine O-acetyltransferase
MNENDPNAVSADIPDWTRERPRRFWEPERKLLHAIRRYQHWHRKDGMIPLVARKWHAARYFFWSTVTGAEIPLNGDIGGGLVLPHPNGIVIHPAAKIGVNCVIFQQVTIGTRGSEGAPVIEGNVDIGAGAKILGPVRIGACAKIGANAVVVTDVPKGATAVGVPARIIPKSDGAQPATLMSAKSASG